MIISKTKGVLSKSSSDLGLGRRPIAISDVFLESTPPSYRDIDVPFSDFFRKRYIVRERDPRMLHELYTAHIEKLYENGRIRVPDSALLMGVPEPLCALPCCILTRVHHFENLCVHHIENLCVHSHVAL